MSDIVERLRASPAAVFGTVTQQYRAMVEERHEAADEIERLRTALAFAASAIKSGEPWTNRCEEVIGRALKDKP